MARPAQNPSGSPASSFDPISLAIWGYYELLKAVKNPKHKEHQQTLDWLGGHFDPGNFDLQKTNAKLRGLGNLARPSRLRRTNVGFCPFAIATPFSAGLSCEFIRSARRSYYQFKRKDILLASDLFASHQPNRNLTKQFPLFKGMRTDRSERWAGKCRGRNVIESHHGEVFWNGKSGFMDGYHRSDGKGIVTGEKRCWMSV
jgi:hypothetical protein